MRRELKPIELDLLAAVQKEQTDVKREIYRKFFAEYSESFLYRTFDALISGSYVKLKQNRKHALWVLSAKGKGALKRQRGSVNGCGVHP